MLTYLDADLVRMIFSVYFSVVGVVAVWKVNPSTLLQQTADLPVRLHLPSPDVPSVTHSGRATNFVKCQFMLHLKVFVSVTSCVMRA